MKTPTSVYRKDSANNHVHTVPGGPDTQGALLKPSHSTQFPVHTHIYEHEGKVHETGVSPDEPGHTHELSTKGDYTGGPKPMPTKESFGPRNDSLTRVGRNWELHTAEGVFKGARTRTMSSTTKLSRNARLTAKTTTLGKKQRATAWLRLELTSGRTFSTPTTCSAVNNPTRGAFNG
jgi:hypothetical protein